MKGMFVIHRNFVLKLGIIQDISNTFIKLVES